MLKPFLACKPHKTGSGLDFFSPLVFKLHFSRRFLSANENIQIEQKFLTQIQAESEIGRRVMWNHYLKQSWMSIFQNE